MMKNNKQYIQPRFTLILLLLFVVKQYMYRYIFLMHGESYVYQSITSMSWACNRLSNMGLYAQWDEILISWYQRDSIQTSSILCNSNIPFQIFTISFEFNKSLESNILQDIYHFMILLNEYHVRNNNFKSMPLKQIQWSWCEAVADLMSRYVIKYHVNYCYARFVTQSILFSGNQIAYSC